MNNLQKKFIQKSDIERGYLKMIIDKLPKKYHYSLYTTPSEGKDVYDALLLRFEENGWKFIDRYIIEIKIRDAHYDSLMLEKIKFDDLKKVRKAKDKKINKECYTTDISKIVYINVTPKGTYWFLLDKLEKDFVWDVKEHWISTTDKSKGKTDKVVTFIDCEKAIKMDIKTGDYIDPNEIKKLNLESKRKKCLAEFLFGDE